MENNLVIEKINFTPETDESKKEIYLLINNQSVKNDLFIKDKNIKKLNNNCTILPTDNLRYLLNSDYSNMYVDKIEKVLKVHTDEHMVKPRLVFISQATEIGTIYKKQEIAELYSYCKENPFKKIN